jgi:hypothetical protein
MTKQNEAKNWKRIRHEDITVSIKVRVVWDVTPCCLVSQKLTAVICKIEIGKMQLIDLTLWPHFTEDYTENMHIH